MRGEKDRCEHCGKWVKLQALYTLFGVNHPESESVAVCMKCDETYSDDYWVQWLNNREWRDGLFVAKQKTEAI